MDWSIRNGGHIATASIGDILQLRVTPDFSQGESALVYKAVVYNTTLTALWEQGDINAREEAQSLAESAASDILQNVLMENWGISTA